MAQNTLLYLPESTLLARRWIEAQPGGARIIVVHAAGHDNAAAELRKTFPAIQELIRVDSSATRQRIAALGADRIVLPISVKPYEMRFHDLAIPDPSSIYPLLRRLHGLGIRKFELFSFHGSRVVEIPHVADDFRDRHRGRRCFIVGNGPSLNRIDMARLRGEITIGANRCYLGFPQWGFNFNYWCVVDQLQVEDYGAEHVAALPAETPKFFPLEYLTYLKPPNGCPVNLHYGRRPDFSPSGESFYRGHTVVTLMLQLAVLMGCDPIVLVGVDHSYNLKGSVIGRSVKTMRNRLVRSISGSPLHEALKAFKRAMHAGKKTRPAMWQALDANSPTHFDDAYTSERKRFQMPNPREVDRDMKFAANWAREHGVTILNATPGTKLQAFEKIPFENLF